MFTLIGSPPEDMYEIVGVTEKIILCVLIKMKLSILIANVWENQWIQILMLIGYGDQTTIFIVSKLSFQRPSST